MTPIPESLRSALAARYALEAEIGRGGMAAVYRAQDVKHGRTVAVKVLAAEIGATVGRERFLREIAIAASLSHPHILPVFDSGAADELLYYVMPLVEGESLRARLSRERQLPLADVLQITRQVADALAYAHSRGVVHRDVKPENILLQGAHAVVADFGIARLTEAVGDERITRTGVVVGTPAYMSPEQASGEAQLDGRSDLYSLACVVYEMLGGEPPHTGPTPRVILARQLTGEVRSLVPVRSTVTPALDAAIRRGLAPAPADRFATVFEFATALEHAAVPGAAPGARGPGARRWRAVAGVAIAVAVAVWWLARIATGGAGPGDGRLGVAVFPFRPAEAGAQPWSETLADFLATALDGTPRVRVADPWALWRHLRPERGAPAGSPDPVEAERLAGQAGAARFVLGSVLQAGERLDLTVRVYQAGLRDPIHAFAASASTDSVAALIQRVAVEIITRVWERGPSPSVPQLERYATHSAEALKAYLAAKEAMRRGLVDSASRSIDRALAADSNFALALVDAGRIKSWWQFMRGEPYTGLLPLAERAVRLSDSLSERQQLRARATLASIRTEGAVAAEALQRLIQLDSTDLDAWDALSYCHLVYGWQYGAREADARLANERVRRLDPTYTPGLVRAAWVIPEERAEAQRALRQLATLDTTTALVQGARWSLRAVLGSDAEYGAFADSVAGAPPSVWFAVLRALRTHAPDRAEDLLARIGRRVAPGTPSVTVALNQIRLAVARGRVRSTDSALAAGAQRAQLGVELQARQLLAAAAVSGFARPADVRRAVDALVAGFPVDSALAQFERRPVWSTGWVAAAYHAMYGDTSYARRWHAAFGTFPGGGTSQDYRGSLQADIEARLAARRGDLPTALALASRALELWTIHTNVQPEQLPEPAMRFHFAALLRATGRPDSAAALFRSLVPPTTWMGFLSARARLELGELAEARGDVAGAAVHYGDALAYWSGDEPEIADLRERARAGLRRVTREGT
jgi:serine/threonine-protein kinase